LKLSSLPLLALVTTLLLSTITACSDTGAAHGGGPPAGPIDVTVVTVAAETVPVDDVLPGRVTALRTAELRAQVGGIVRRRLFKEGEQVKEGQRLYQIDPSVYRVEVKSAQAMLERRRAGLDLAKREADRQQALLKGGAVTVQSADAATTTYQLAQADLAEAEAALSRSELSLGYASLVAPIAGRIGISRVSEGALVGPADPTPLATIQQVEEVYVDLKQSAARYEALLAAFASGRIARSENVVVTVLSLSGQAYEQQGKLVFTDISVDQGTGDITLRVLVPNPEMRLLPGMFVRARLTFGQEEGALLVPQQAVQRNPSLGAFVLVVDAADKIVARPITTDRIVAGRSVIASGLAAGDRVVVEGHDKLQPGTAVKAVPWRASTPEVPAKQAAPDASKAEPAPPPKTETPPSSSTTTP